MWSPTKLDFLFYDFFMIYCDFSKIQRNKKIQTTITVATHRYCSDPPLLWQPAAKKKTSDSKIDGFEKFRGKTDGFIVKSEVERWRIK